ncbi:putative mitochondrial protein [Phytophthora megakarya]|uniref:Putative mitochondrial protein n=1 Tax=Phytophthora megakarya TaxID=4795 RepID=A0A225VT25_9STRA|nr:putative mitochondrial protein [Phytophthora megakarya]
MSRCMVFFEWTSFAFWGDAVQYAAYILNRCPTTANPNRASPMEMLTGVVASLSDIVTLGSACTAYHDPGKRYTCRVIVTQHVQNVETLNAAGNVQLQEQLQKEDPELGRAVQLREEVLRRKELGHGTTQPKDRAKYSKKPAAKSKSGSTTAEGGTCGDNEVSSHDELVPQQNLEPERMRTRNMSKKHVPVAKATISDDPNNYSEAMRSAQAKEWSRAMDEEINALEANGTWEIVVKPKNEKLLHSKWVFKTKKHADGSLERFKARPVACGNEQEYGVDYVDTFSAALEGLSAKIVLALARKYNVPARHGDVPNAYVRAGKESDLEILLHVPRGMSVDAMKLTELGAANEGQVALRLLKSLCMYKRGSGSDLTIVGVYVDDLLVTGAKVANVDKFFKDMKVLDVKDLGNVSKFLGTGVV